MLKTYAAISNAHLSSVCKWGKLSGSCLSTLNGFGSTQLPIFLCHIGVPTFLHKIINESVFEISIDIFSELIVSALKTYQCSSVESNDVHNNPGYEYDSGRVYTICMVI